ncbi:MAG: SDR family oxidoreductase [Eubacterium sp.]|nr:SDR family oxidoreductase [Eubacterium sp.]
MKFFMDWIYGKTILITGASSGLGRAMTVQLIREQNCKVIGVGQSEEKMMSLKEELTYLRDDFDYRIFDVSVQENWTWFAEELMAENIQIDLLINNAGILLPFDKSVNYTEKQVQSCMDINFHGCRYAINAMLPILRQSTMAGIVNISSSDALAGIIGTSIYSASKAALKAYTEVLIAELGREMYIGYVCPGFIRTDIFRNQYVISESRLIKMASSKVDKAAKKIVKKIVKQKSRMIVGKDAKFMNFTSKFFPVLGLKFYEQLIKHSKIEMFENIK